MKSTDRSPLVQLVAVRSVFCFVSSRLRRGEKQAKKTSAEFTHTQGELLDLLGRYEHDARPISSRRVGDGAKEVATNSCNIPAHMNRVMSYSAGFLRSTTRNAPALQAVCRALVPRALHHP